MAPLPPVNSTSTASASPPPIPNTPAKPPETSPGHATTETWGTAEKMMNDAVKAAVLGAVAKAAPWIAPLVVMRDTIVASHDPQIEKDATAAGFWCEHATGSRVIGGLCAAADATGKSLFNATLGKLDTAIDDGAAAAHIMKP